MRLDENLDRFINRHWWREYYTKYKDYFIRMIVRDDKANLILRYWVFSDDILNTVCLGTFFSLEEAKRFIDREIKG